MGEKKDMVHDLLVDAMEDLAMIHAIQKGESTEPVNRAEVFPIEFLHKKKGLSDFSESPFNTGRDERIRTSGPLNPIQVRYQTALHPDPKLF